MTSPLDCTVPPCSRSRRLASPLSRLLSFPPLSAEMQDEKLLVLQDSTRRFSRAHPMAVRAPLHSHLQGRARAMVCSSAFSDPREPISSPSSIMHRTRRKRDDFIFSHLASPRAPGTTPPSSRLQYRAEFQIAPSRGWILVFVYSPLSEKDSPRCSMYFMYLCIPVYFSS